MKALSLRQPWAELILLGRKTVETRTWNTSFRGPFLLHAARQVDVEAMDAFGMAGLPLGCIVGQAELEGVRHYTTEADFAKDFSLHLYKPKEWTGQRYGFVLKDVQRVEPVSPCKGALGFFEV